MKPLDSSTSREHKFIIDSLAFGGEGISRLEGKVWFIEGGLPGEQVLAKVREEKKSFGRATVTQILAASPHRIEPPCPYYSKCGGCQYQHLSYPEELVWKTKQVQELLLRLGKLSDPVVLPIIACPQPYGYRNRISVHAESGRVGFHQAGTRDVIDIEKCLLASDEVNLSLQKLREERPFSGHFSLRAVDVPISAFFQSNQFLLQSLLASVKTLATGSQGTLLEGYAGGGFFTSALSSQFSRVIAIESDGRALRDAQRLNLKQVEWIEGRVEDHLEMALRKLGEAPDLILMDPPRTGLDQKISGAVAASKAQKLIYVSCNPSTLARDASILKASYRLVSLQPIDMFPRTAQIETVSLWERC